MTSCTYLQKNADPPASAQPEDGTVMFGSMGDLAASTYCSCVILPSSSMRLST